MEFVLEGCSWLFRRQLILFEHLLKSVDREDIRLVKSVFWMKVGSYLSERDNKGLMHAIGSTFGSLLQS